MSLGAGFEVSELNPGPVALSFFLLPVVPDVELSAPSVALCPPVMDSETLSKTQLNAFFY